MAEGARVPPAGRRRVSTIGPIAPASRENTVSRKGAAAWPACPRDASGKAHRHAGNHRAGAHRAGWARPSLPTGLPELTRPFGALLRWIFRQRSSRAGSGRTGHVAGSTGVESAERRPAPSLRLGEATIAPPLSRIAGIESADATAGPLEAGPPERGFLAGTPVMLMTGAADIDRLARGLRLVTRSGAMPVLALRRRRPRKPLVHVAPDVFGPDQSTALVLGADQPVRLEPWRQLLFPGRGPVVRAAELVDGQFVTRLAPRPGMMLVEILTGRPALARIGGHDFPTSAPMPAETADAPAKEDPVANLTGAGKR